MSNQKLVHCSYCLKSPRNHVIVEARMFAENKITIDDFNNICRFCLAIQQTDIPIKFNPIFKDNGSPVNRALLKMITACLGFDVRTGLFLTLILNEPHIVMLIFCILCNCHHRTYQPPMGCHKIFVRHA